MGAPSHALCGSWDGCSAYEQSSVCAAYVLEGLLSVKLIWSGLGMGEASGDRASGYCYPCTVIACFPEGRVLLAGFFAWLLYIGLRRNFPVLRWLTGRLPPSLRCARHCGKAYRLLVF